MSCCCYYCYCYNCYYCYCCSSSNCRAASLPAAYADSCNVAAEGDDDDDAVVGGDVLLAAARAARPKRQCQDVSLKAPNSLRLGRHVELSNDRACRALGSVC